MIDDKGNKLTSLIYIWSQVYIRSMSTSFNADMQYVLDNFFFCGE